MDLSTLSDDDLRRLANNDYSKLSDDAKTMFKEAPKPVTEAQSVTLQPQPVPQQTGPVAPDLGGMIMDYGVTPAVGAAQTAAQFGLANPVTTGIAASYIPGINKLPGISTIKAGREAASNILNRFAGTPGAAAPTPGSPGYPIGGAPTNVPPGQPNVIQQGTDIASKMRQAAAQRVLGAAVVPAAVGAGGYKAAQTATNQMANMTPEQRRAYYDNQMLGAMGGDAALAAAIMNRGQ
jgi:hypothetical protein